MKIYTAIETDYEIILNVYSFKTRGDAEEFILSCAEEEILNIFNSLCMCAPVPTGKYVINNWKNEASLYHRSLEGHLLHEGARWWNKIYESELLD